MAYVLTRDSGDWIQQAELTADDALDGDLFGVSVGLDSDTVVIGAYGDDGGGTDSGAAHVFTRDGDVWTRQATLTADDASHFDFFGVSVAVDGDSAIIGANGDDDGGSSSGAAYVFTG